MAITPKILFGYNDIKAWYRRLKKCNNKKYYFIKSYSASDDIVLCKKKKIDIIFPVSIKNCLFLSKNSKKYSKKDIKFLISPNETLQLLNDKSKFVQFMYNNNFDNYVPKKYDQINCPCIIKKKISLYGYNTYIINEESDIPKNINLNNYLIQELIPGIYEYATHILAKNGIIEMYLTNQYSHSTELYVRGHSCKGIKTEEIILDPNIYNIFSEILKKINYDGFCCFDYKIVDTNIPKIFEINARIGASVMRCSMLDQFIQKYCELSY